ncbi:hypothetical protein HY572_01955 [Candidatus Micrarchaeota archaeon]|nr:hypothetical protein [Candidatus Micrarchaeota archaeon]
MSQLHSALNRAIESHDALRRFTRSIARQPESVELPDLFDSVHRILAERDWNGLFLPDTERGAYDRLKHGIKAALAHHLSSTAGIAYIQDLARVGTLMQGQSRHTAGRHFLKALDRGRDDLKESHSRLFDAFSALQRSLDAHYRQRIDGVSDPQRLAEEKHAYRKISSGLAELDSLLDHLVIHLDDPGIAQAWMNAHQSR